MHYQHGGESTQFMHPGGVLHQGEKFGRNAFVQGSLHWCIWEPFVTWILVVLFCRWCRTLLLHLEESTILEHFISVVSSRFPCLRGPRFFSLKWSCFGFCLSFDHLFKFFICFFSFYLFSRLVTMCVLSMHSSRWDWGPKRPRTGGWSLLAMMSDWQRGVDWLLAEYCSCRLQLDLRWCRWRAGAKGFCLAGPPSSAETSRLGSRDLEASGVKCGTHGAKKRKTKSWAAADEW
jgi:hypothetical protein